MRSVCKQVVSFEKGTCPRDLWRGVCRCCRRCGWPHLTERIESLATSRRHANNDDNKRSTTSVGRDMLRVFGRPSSERFGCAVEGKGWRGRREGVGSERGQNQEWMTKLVDCRDLTTGGRCGNCRRGGWCCRLVELSAVVDPWRIGKCDHFSSCAPPGRRVLGKDPFVLATFHFEWIQLQSDSSCPESAQQERLPLRCFVQRISSIGEPNFFGRTSPTLALFEQSRSSKSMDFCA